MVELIGSAPPRDTGSALGQMVCEPAQQMVPKHGIRLAHDQLRSGCGGTVRRMASHARGGVYKCDRHRYRCRYRFWRLRHDDGEGAATGLSADASGYWAVHDVLDVRRPKKRRGQQLEVLISWAAHE